MKVFGVELNALVPPSTVKVPMVLERCLNHIEVKGEYIQQLNVHHVHPILLYICRIVYTRDLS